MDTNMDLTEQLKFSKLRKKTSNSSQATRSPQVCLAWSQSAKHLNSTPKGSAKLYFKAEINPPGSGSKPKVEHQQQRATSIEKRGRQKIRRTNSGILKVDKERLNTDTNLKKRISSENSPKPNISKNPILSYLSKKSKSPNAAAGSQTNPRGRSRKNFSFTTINNFSMQNLINKNMSNYQTYLSKASLVTKDIGYPPHSPCGQSISGMLLNNSKISGLPAGYSLNQSIGGGASRENGTPNFQKKLKKYISKRANVLKKTNHNG